MDALRAIYEQAASRGGSITAEGLAELIEQNSDLGAFLHLINGSESSELQSAIRGQRYGSDSKYSTLFENGVVVLDLIGPIYPRANMMTSSGAVSLAQFVSEFGKAYNDPDVAGIVMNIDSPGGDVRGLSDASALMYNYSKKKRKKPVKAFASGYMASAAYHLGSVAQEVVGSRSSIVGSIGVVSKAQALPSGQYEIVSSQSPFKRVDPATEDGQAVIREMVNDMASIMIEDIAEFRGVSQEKVLSDYGQGKTMVGPRAKKSGLLDSIGTLGSVVESVAKEAQTGSYRQTKRKVSAEVETLLSFTSEEIETMGLKDLANKFKASTAVVDDVESDEQAQSDPATVESEDTVVEGQGLTGEDEGVETPAVDPKAIQARRDELEERFSDGAELFATHMTLDSRIFPAQQSYAASDLLIAKIDDSIYGGTVGYVNADGEVSEGTREEAVRARYNAMPKHSMTKKAIAGIKDGSVEAKVLAEEDEDTDEKTSNAPIDPERKNKLLSLTTQGQRALAHGSNKQ